jgi:hypothetical protein
MDWTRVNSTAIRCAPWKVCRVMVMGVEWYEVWRDGEKPYVARFRTADEAKGYCRESAANQPEGVR